jgi:hypothetical protein
MQQNNETKQFWLMLYAMEGFEIVIRACDSLLNNKYDHFDINFQCIITAILTIYGRPWHKNEGVGKLEDVLVPEEYKALHLRLITERDKIFAHKDAKGFQTPIGNANQIRLLRSKDGFTWMCNNFFSFDTDDIKRIHCLCKILFDKLDYHTSKYQNKCIKEIKFLPEGEYILNTDNNTSELFQKTESIVPSSKKITITNCPYQSKL